MNSEAKLDRLIVSVSSLRADVQASRIQPYAFRSDREAAAYCGFKSPWRFTLWATKHGLKPKAKPTMHTRTIYRRTDLERVLDAEANEQFDISTAVSPRRAGRPTGQWGSVARSP